MTQLHRFDSPAAAAAAAAEAVASRAVSSAAQRRRFRLGLSGGRTPAELYRRLAAGQTGPAVEWSAVELFFADERAAPPTEPESNYWMVRKLLIEPAGIPPGQVHRMRAEAEDLEAAARDYEGRLSEPLDLLLLGVGEDGHTASLFPGSPLIFERTRRVAAVFDSPKPPPRRMTVTPRVIEEAREVLVLATGADKARAVALALEGEVVSSQVPARLLREKTWYLDRSAARDLRGAA